MFVWPRANLRDHSDACELRVLGVESESLNEGSGNSQIGVGMEEPSEHTLEQTLKTTITITLLNP